MKNSIKKTLPFVTSLAALFLIVVVAKVAPRRPDVPYDKSKGQVGSYVAYAKKHKLTKIDVPSHTVRLYPVGDAKGGTVVEARLLSQKTIANDAGLITQNRFQILETITTSPSLPPPDNMPAPEGFQLNRGEFVLTTEGGTAVMDGVEVQQQKTPVVGKNYLIFVTLTSRGFGIPVHGMGGLFEIEDNGALKPFSSQQTSLSHFVNTHGNNLAAVKAGLTSAH